MKTVSRFLFLSLSLFLVACSDDDKPNVEQVEPALKTFLVLEKARTCGGTVTVDRVSIFKIGDYDGKLDGYPVYATFGVTCAEISGNSTWSSDDSSMAKFTAVVRKKTSGEFECFMPDAFKEQRNALQRQTDQVPDDLLKTDAPKPIKAPH